MEKYIPKSAKGDKIKYLAVSAHKDDIEMMAFDAIVKGQNGGFAAAVLTHGGACPRSEKYKDVDEEDMAELRTAEQKRASEVGKYEALYLFEKNSKQVKEKQGLLIDEIYFLLSDLPRLDALYLHNIFDKHPTHVGACLCVIEAVRRLPNDLKPLIIYGCEVWRGLDWLSDEKKVLFDVHGEENDKLSKHLMDCFVSQIDCKRYDIASLARRKANATYYNSHEGDESDALIFGIDMTKLGYAQNSIDDYINEVIGSFERDVKKNLH